MSSFHNLVVGGREVVRSAANRAVEGVIDVTDGGRDDEGNAAPSDVRDVRQFAGRQAADLPTSVYGRFRAISKRSLARAEAAVTMRESRMAGRPR